MDINTNFRISLTIQEIKEAISLYMKEKGYEVESAMYFDVNGNFQLQGVHFEAKARKIKEN